MTLEYDPDNLQPSWTPAKIKIRQDVIAVADVNTSEGYIGVRFFDGSYGRVPWHLVAAPVVSIETETVGKSRQERIVDEDIRQWVKSKYGETGSDSNLEDDVGWESFSTSDARLHGEPLEIEYP